MSGDPFPNPTGWEVSYNDAAVSDPWQASHLDQGVTVFGRDIADLGLAMIDEHRRHSPDARWLARVGSR